MCALGMSDEGGAAQEGVRVELGGLCSGIGCLGPSPCSVIYCLCSFGQVIVLCASPSSLIRKMSHTTVVRGADSGAGVPGPKS